QLGADDQRHHSADAEIDERADQVHVPDLLVVSRRDPLNQYVALADGARRDRVVAGAGTRDDRTDMGLGGTLRSSAHGARPYPLCSGTLMPGRFVFVLYSAPRVPVWPASARLWM